MKSFIEVFPDIESLSQLQPEELGAALLEHINSWSEGELRTLGSQNTTTALAVLYPDRQDEIKRILTEGWVWLESEGFLAPLPGSNRGLSFVTRKGKQFSHAQQLDSYRKMKLLAGSLHSRIDEKARAAFLRETTAVQCLRPSKRSKSQFGKRAVHPLLSSALIL